MSHYKILPRNTKIGVIVVHFGNIKDTIACITSLNKMNTQSLHVVIYVIDNDTDNRIQKKKIHTKLPIKIYTTHKNMGWGSGANNGIVHALADGCSYILLLNNDAIVSKNIFVNMLPFFEKEEIGMVSPVILYYDNPNIIWCSGGKLNRKFLFTKHLFMNKSINSLTSLEPIEADYGGTCLLVKTEVFKKIGLFDSRYFLYAEDVEWCFRAKTAGFRLIYDPKTFVFHKISANAGVRGSNTLNVKSGYFLARNFFIFLKDHKDDIHISTAIFGQIFISLPYYLFFRIRTYHSIRMYLKGLFHGFFYLFTGKLFSPDFHGSTRA